MRDLAPRKKEKLVFFEYMNHDWVKQLLLVAPRLNPRNHTYHQHHDGASVYECMRMGYRYSRDMQEWAHER